MAKTKLVSDWVANMMVAALNFIVSKFVSKLPSDWAREMLMRISLNPLTSVIKAVSDEDPQNKEQVEEILRRFIHDDVTAFSAERLNAALLRIGDENLREAIRTVSLPSFDMVRALTDDVADDTEQIRRLWESWLTDEKTANAVIVHVLLPILQKKLVKDDAALAMIQSVLLSFVHSFDADGDGHLG